ncbi:MAG: type II secretion system F family protein [Acidimicrobiia bacterium]
MTPKIKNRLIWRLKLLLWRRSIGLAVLIGTLLAAGPAALGAEELSARIREAGLDPDGSTRLIVSVSGNSVKGQLSAENFTITEAGRPVQELDVQPLFTSNLRPVSAVVVIDVSGSMAGKAMADAKAAAKSFIQGLPSSVRVAIVAFGSTAETRAHFTTDRAVLNSTIDKLEARGETALYDGVVLAADLLSKTDSQRNAVIFTDGKDTVSQASLQSAVEALKSTGAGLAAVGLATKDYDGSALQAMVSPAGGTLLAVDQSGALSEAFGQIAREISSQYLLIYRSAATSPKDLDLSVAVRIGSADATDTITVPNPRTAAAAELESQIIKAPSGFLSTPLGLTVAAGLLFTALTMMFWLVIRRPRGGQATKVLRKGLTLYARRDRTMPGFDRAFAKSEIGRRAVEFIEKMPQANGYEARLQLELDRSGWPMRASEFIVIQAVAAVLMGVIWAVISSSIWIAIIAVAIGGWIPRLVLARRVSQRSSKFLSQLPDTLQLISASIRAGYGLMQAIDTVVKEAQSPTSDEFARVLSEIRLGMPIDESLEEMAKRIASEEFRWVIVAMVIQRQVGGNLAALLETVANTLREREQLRRQVKVLSAEGRLSAVILTALPFVMTGYLVIVNREYLEPLYKEAMGKLMIASGLLLIGLGVAWLRKVIRIEV